MGGSGWSGSSGRGGISYGQGGYPEQPRYPQHPQHSQQGGYPQPQHGGYSQQGGYSEQPRYQQGGYPHERDSGHFSEGEYRASQGQHPREGADNTGGFPRESGFPREQGIGHVPGQRWSGGYGGDVDRGPGPGPGPGAPGRGFSGSDFGPPSQGHPSGGQGQRHFGNQVDRGGRGPGGSDSHGVHGTDMGMGAPEDDRGPHYGKGPKGYQRSDVRTHDEVCEAIAHQGHIDASDVEVTVANGIVKLAGTVTHREDKRGLEHLVERQRGVDEVHNELRLKRPAAPETRESPKVPARQGPSSQGNGDVNDHQNGKPARS